MIDHHTSIFHLPSIAIEVMNSSASSLECPPLTIASTQADLQASIELPAVPQR